MATVPVCNNNFIRQRVLLDTLYPEPTTFGDCDCTSYSYLCLSLALISFGTFVTVASLSGNEENEFIFSNMGHMWLIGPICISSGIMIAIKIVLYLRRKSVIQMALRHGALVSGCLDWLEEHVERMGSVVQNPPAYDLVITDPRGPFEAPPPSYEDAVFLLNAEKPVIIVNNQQNNEESCCSKESGTNDSENSCSSGMRVNSIVNCCSSNRSTNTTENCCGGVAVVEDIPNFYNIETNDNEEEHFFKSGSSKNNTENCDSHRICADTENCCVGKSCKNVTRNFSGQGISDNKERCYCKMTDIVDGDNTSSRKQT